MSARTIIFAIGLTALAAFFAVTGIGAYVARGRDDLFDVVTLCSIAAGLVWGVVLLVRGDGDEEQRGFEVEWHPEHEVVGPVIVSPADELEAEADGKSNRDSGDHRKEPAEER